MKTLVILEDDCDGQANEFIAFVKENHPEIEIDFRARTSGVGGGLYDDGDYIDNGNDYWAEYCNS